MINEDEVMAQYGDIINLPHYQLKHHQHLSAWSRAAQFAPFAALEGYEDALKKAYPQIG